MQHRYKQKEKQSTKLSKIVDDTKQKQKSKNWVTYFSSTSIGEREEKKKGTLKDVAFRSRSHQQQEEKETENQDQNQLWDGRNEKTLSFLFSAPHFSHLPTSSSLPDTVAAPCSGPVHLWAIQKGRGKGLFSLHTSLLRNQKKKTWKNERCCLAAKHANYKKRKQKLTHESTGENWALRHSTSPFKTRTERTEKKKAV